MAVLLNDVTRGTFTRGVRVGKAIHSTSSGDVRCIGIMLRAVSSAFITNIAADPRKRFVFGGATTKSCELILSDVKCGAKCVALGKMGHRASLKPVMLSDTSVTLRKIAVANSDRVDHTSHGLIFPSRERVGASAGKIGLLRRLVLPHVLIGPVGGRVKLSNNKRLRLHVGKIGTRVSRVGTVHPTSVVHVRCRSGPKLHCNGTRIILSCVIHHPRANKGFNTSVSRKLGAV